VPENAVPINDLSRHNAALLPALAEALRSVGESGWYILGPRVREFEAAFAPYCGVDHCIGTGNGTDALELALRATGVRPGDEVVTAANAGGYATTAILACGAIPLFADVDPVSMLLDPDAVEAVLTPKARAIVATHLYGRMADMQRILAIARKAGVATLEDCAQAHGARLEGRPAGAWGDAGCFSFYPTKNLGALGDGGAIVTSDSAIAERARCLRQYGWSSRYTAGIAGGRNSRLDEMQAAVLTVKLPCVDDWNARRRAIASRYSEAFRSLDLIAAPPPHAPEYVAHLYVLRVGDRARFREGLAAAGICTDVHYPLPDYRQPCWAQERWAQCRLPVTDRCCREVVTLPCFPELSDAEVARVVTAVRSMPR
jgi:dTDP-4-amino-4,6-dideoxygalactose transaminase